MYKKILEKVASAGTLAVLGYEIGSHVNDDGQVGKVTHENHSTNVIIFGVICFIFILIAIIARLVWKKRPIV